MTSPLVVTSLLVLPVMWSSWSGLTANLFVQKTDQVFVDIDHVPWKPIRHCRLSNPVKLREFHRGVRQRGH